MPRKPLPPSDPRLERLRILAHIMDESLPVPGTQWRIGLDALIGLIPGIGDLIGTAISLYIIAVAASVGAPIPTLARMLLNVGVEGVVGLVPLLGDLFDAGWKANRRNITLLEARVQDPRRSRRDAWVVAAAIGMVLLCGVAILAGIVALAIAVVRWLA